MTSTLVGRADDRVRVVATLRDISALTPMPWRRLTAASMLGGAAAVATVALMATSGALIDKAALRPPIYTLTVLMAAVQLLALCRGPLRYCERLVSHDAAFGVGGRLRLWLYDILEPRSPGALGPEQNRGDVLAAATGDLDIVQALYQRGISPLVVGISTALVASVLCAFVLPLAGLIVAVGLTVTAVLTCALAWARQRHDGHIERELRAELAGQVVELVEGARDLVAFGVDDHYLARAMATDDELARLARRRAWSAGLVTAVSLAGIGVTLIALVAVGVHAVAAHQMAAYLLAVLPLVTLGAFEAVGAMAEAVAQLPIDIAAGARLLAVADLAVPVTDTVVQPTTPTSTDIDIEGVDFRYEVGAPLALDGLDLTVPEGAHIAVVGSSGAGKSTIVNLLLRFATPERGQLSMGGTAFDQLGGVQVRSRIGWVDQEPHLFNTSIRANVALADPQTTGAQVAEAVRAAQLGPWIDSLPEGLDTLVGENGNAVSGGQRQRIALARTLLADTTVLVLDEPTSGLDHPTAERLLDDVIRTAGDRSIICITHRDEELHHFDHVIRIDSGRVDETEQRVH